MALNAVLAVLRDKVNQVPGAVYYVQDSDIEQNEREVYIRKTLKWVTENELTEVYLQPIVRSDTHEIVGAEALARRIYSCCGAERCHQPDGRADS